MRYRIVREYRDRVAREYRVTREKRTLVKHSLSFMNNNPNHTFFAVTVRPYEAFIKKIYCDYRRVRFVEELVSNLYHKYQSYLTPLNTKKTKNQHLRIVTHNAIETKTKHGSPDIPHSHGIWGIPNEILHEWGYENGVFDQLKNKNLTKNITRRGHIHFEEHKIPLHKVIHSVEAVQLITNPIEKLFCDPKYTPERWVKYLYKWYGDEGSEWFFVGFGDGESEHLFVRNPITKTKKEISNAPSTILNIPPNKLTKPIHLVPTMV